MLAQWILVLALLESKIYLNCLWEADFPVCICSINELANGLSKHKWVSKFKQVTNQQNSREFYTRDNIHSICCTSESYILQFNNFKHWSTWAWVEYKSTSYNSHSQFISIDHLFPDFELHLNSPALEHRFQILLANFPF